MKYTKLRLFPSLEKMIMSFAITTLLFMGIYTVAFSTEKYSTVQGQGNSTTPPTTIQPL